MLQALQTMCRAAPEQPQPAPGPGISNLPSGTSAIPGLGRVSSITQMPRQCFDC